VSKLLVTGRELERYYRFGPEEVDGPIWWYINHNSIFPRLSTFEWDVLAIPSFSTSCDGEFGLVKLTVTSKGQSLLGSSMESVQLLKS
jgi:hypothetical protein